MKRRYTKYIKYMVTYGKIENTHVLMSKFNGKPTNKVEFVEKLIDYIISNPINKAEFFALLNNIQLSNKDIFKGIITSIGRKDCLYNLLKLLIETDAFANEEKCKIYDKIFKEFISNNFSKVDDKTFYLILKIYAKKLISQGYFAEKSPEKRPYIHVLHNKKQVDSCFCTAFVTPESDEALYINNDVFLKDSKENTINAIVIIGHELQHFAQHSGYKYYDKYNLISFIWAKDIVIRRILGKNYYNQNYNYLPSEQEANYIGWINAANELQFYGLDSKEAYEKSQEYKEMIKYPNTQRIAYGCTYDIEYVFDKVINDLASNGKDCSWILTEIPILNLQYICLNGRLCKKNIETLNYDYQSYKSKINNPQIDLVYQYIFKNYNYQTDYSNIMRF